MWSTKHNSVLSSSKWWFLAEEHLLHNTILTLFKYNKLNHTFYQHIYFQSWAQASDRPWPKSNGHRSSSFSHSSSDAGGGRLCCLFVFLSTFCCVFVSLSTLCLCRLFVFSSTLCRLIVFFCIFVNTLRSMIGQITHKFMLWAKYNQWSMKKYL